MKIQTRLQNIKNYKIYLQVEEALHEFLQKKGYFRVNLPVLSPALIPESYLDVFATEFHFLNNKEKFYLIPAPELFLKRLLVAGLGNCYSLSKCFRNSELPSSLHSPEFTMLEFYRLGANYMDVSDELLELLRFIAQKLDRRDEIIYQGKKISFTKWEKLSVTEAFKKFSQISQNEIFDAKIFLKKAKTKGYRVDGFSYQDIFSQIITQEIEPHLGKNGYATLLYDYPSQMSALAKLKPDGKIAERVEFYIDGIEIGGCCTELTDCKEQESRYEREIEAKKKLGQTVHTIDKGLISELKYGLADCTGSGVGFDRLAMIFANVKSIKELQLINIL